MENETSTGQNEVRTEILKLLGSKRKNHVYTFLRKYVKSTFIMIQRSSTGSNRQCQQNNCTHKPL